MLDLDTPSGRVAFRVGGIALDFVPEGSITLSRTTYERLWRDPTVTAFFVDAAPGVAPKEARDRIERSLGNRQGIVVRVNEDVRRHALDLLEEGFAYTRAIEGAALLVSLLGLASTVLVSVLERKRELGVLRAVGMTRGALARMIVVEMASLGLAASVTALLLGAFHARFWLGGVLAEEVGWPLVVNVPLEAVLFTVSAGILAGVVAGLLGAERASSSELSDALSSP
jgi:putative ABC transport system permease protein